MILGIRPEEIEVATFSRKEGKAAATGFPAIVDIVEPMGAETNLYLQTGTHSLVCRSQGALRWSTSPTTRCRLGSIAV